MIDLFQPPQILRPSKRRELLRYCRQLIPQELLSIREWADQYYRVLNNDRDTFNTAESPWLWEPLRMAEMAGVSELDYVKPIQVGGGTSLGEIILFRRLLDSHGLIEYNWPTNDKAKDRWKLFTEKRILACQPLQPFLPQRIADRFMKFPGIVFKMQGVYESGNLDSDTVDIMINEEVHQWRAGMLAKAKGRQTRVDFPKFINISNAGKVGDQLHQSFNEGTQQHYQVKCPGCGQYHITRTRFEDNRPELGGLRYDVAGCKRADGTFDYNRLIPSIRYHFPCGYELPDDIRLRRDAAIKGKYTEPLNTGALASHRSYTLQAVACHTKRWLDLIQRKHLALRMLKAGDDTEFRLYLQEDETQFYDEAEHRPYQGAIVITSEAHKNREGLPHEAVKAWAADWQQGYANLGELTHYWLVIESVLHNCSSQVLFAGKVADEAEMLGVLSDHAITLDLGIYDGFVDASKNQKQILSFCFRYGVNAVVGGDYGQRSFRWPDGSQQYFSTKQYIYKRLNLPEPKYPLVATREGWVEANEEPFIINYNKAGLLKNHFFIREMKSNVLKSNPEAGPEQYIERIVPHDIGEDYLKHHEAWERDHTATAAKGMGEVEGFRKVRPKDHLMSCTTYIDLYKDLSGLLGAALAKMGLAKPETK